MTPTVIIAITIAASCLLFYMIYFDYREEENRRLLREIERLQDKVIQLENDNRILKGRLGEVEGRRVL